MRRATTFSLLLAVLGSSITSNSTLAQTRAAPSPDDEIAKGLFIAGKAAFDAGRYQEAYDSFFEAFEHSQRPALLWNIAVALDRLRRDKEALANYRGYLQEVPDAENRDEVENRIRALERAVDESKSSTAPPAAAPVLAVDPSAVAVPNTETTAPTGPTDRDESVLTRWWFWTAAGVVVTAVVVGVVVASSGDDVRSPMPGSDGMIVLTLMKAP